jgi:GTP-binding protein
VGRPNVGKSSLFNRILNKKIAVVNDEPGVTRDRNYHETSWNNRRFNLVDTGGLLPGSKESIPVEVHHQVEIAINESAAIIFLVEALPGPTALDEEIARRLRKHCAGKVILTVNKTESREANREFGRHRCLGCGEPVPISAIHGTGVGDVLDRVCELIDANARGDAPQGRLPDLNCAIVGRPNAGKSSFVNKLLGDERMIVDTVPGTTRDAIDSTLIWEKKTINLIDTAGLRKRTQVYNDIEYYANLRAIESIKRCDICILMIDAFLGIGEQDLKIAEHAYSCNKGIIVCWNKWDLVKKDTKTFDTLVAETRRTYRQMQFAPMVSVSARSGLRVTQVLRLAMQVKERMLKRIGAAKLRDHFFHWTKTHPHPYIATKSVRFMGIKQGVATHPHFNIFCTNPLSVVPSYQRYLVNKIQDSFDFSGCQVTLAFKPSGKTTHRIKGRPAEDEKE